jgi:hypothetical protein
LSPLFLATAFFAGGLVLPVFFIGADFYPLRLIGPAKAVPLLQSLAGPR